VLVVDDERSLREALRRVLQAEGYAVHVAESGPQGLEQLQTHPVQLVISDKDMPGMSGVDFLDRVRDRWPRVCRVMLTGRADLESAMGAINRGEVYRFIEKPYNTEQLLVTVFFAFETIELEAENRRLHHELKRNLDVVSRQARELEIERARSEHLLLNVLPGPIAERLKNGEVGIADRFPEATVLFSDMVSFTELSAGLPPADVVSLLSDMFSAFDQLAGAHRVEKIKTLGDGYLAAAGLPATRTDHAWAMADMALGMQQALAEVNAQRGTKLQMRIGMHSGPVVAGVIGLKKFSYDLWGDTVNTASRMEATGLPGRIHVTDAVQRALGGDYVFERRGVIEVKGKGPLSTWFLMGHNASRR
jgi:class 3 adenylate cyclase